MRRLLLLLLFTLAALFGVNEQVVLQLKWLHQFQFAGYYAALEKGFYRDAGLDVLIKERDLRYNNIEQVINNEAQYGIADSVLLLYTNKQKPLKIISPIFQHSPGVIITLKSSGIDTPHKLQNRDFTFYKKDTDGFAILSMLKTMEVTPKLNRSKDGHAFQKLIDKKTDAFAAYLTNEVYLFQKQGIPINIINPANYGYDLYGDMLFTNAQEAKNHPKRVEKFKEASIKGWKYALAHKEEIIQLIKKRYAPNKSLDHLRYEANAIEQMMQSRSIPIGTLDKGRIEYTLKLYEKHALLKNDIPINDYIFESYHSSKLNLTAEETAYLETKKTLKLCIDPDWMPFEKNDKGKYIGMSADYIKLIETWIEKPITMVDTTSWNQSLAYGKARKCDMFSLVMSTPERLNYLEFTQPYIISPLVIATKIDQIFIDNLLSVQHKPIGVVRGYAYAEILRTAYPDMNLIDVPTLTEGLKQVQNGKLFGMVDSLATIGHQIQKQYVGELKIAGKFNEKFELGIGTRNDEPLLKSILNKAIANISTDNDQTIFNKWVSVSYEKGINYILIAKWTGGAVLVLGTILLLIMRINRQLNKEIRKRKEIEQKLQKQIDLVDENIIHSSTDLKGIITKVSKAFCIISGYDKDELIGKTHKVIKSDQTTDKQYKELWETITSNEIYNGEFLNRNKLGDLYWMQTTITPIFDIDGSKIGYTSISHDITNKKRVEILSITDELTGLYNRRHFNSVISKEFNRAKRDCQNFFFLMLDIDYFKSYNDTYGHQAGDKVLQKIGEIFNAHTQRGSDFAFRLGGEEFGIIFSERDFAEGVTYAQMIRNEIEALKIPHSQSRAAVYITASIGLVFSECPRNIDTDMLYKIADENLYQAKEEGRNRVVASEVS